MLGKLIKYDLKRQFHVWGLFYGVLGILSLVSAVCHLLLRQFENQMVLYVMSQFLTATVIIGCIGGVVVSSFYVILYFRKNLFKDEGYLMHTLPVKAKELYLSKIVTGSLMVYASAVGSLFAFGLSQADFNVYGEVVQEAVCEFGRVEGSVLLWLFAGFLLIGVPATISVFFVSISLGYTWNIKSETPVNKYLLSVVAYVAIYMIEQVVMVVVLVMALVIFMGTGVLNPEDLFRNQVVVENPFGIVYTVFGILYLIFVIQAIVYGWISIRRMKKNLNLE